MKITALCKKLFWLAPCLAGLAFSPAGLAQSINSGPQLKAACETAPGNVVPINQPTKIEFGPGQTVATGCTLQIGPSATFEVKQVGMTFAGALNILSSHKTKVAFENASWSAASVNVSLTATSSEVTVKQGTLRADTGNLSVTLGDASKFAHINSYAGAANGGVLHGLEAAGSITLSAGNKFSLVMEDVVGRAGTGIAFNLGGADSSLKLDTTELSSGGAFSIVSASSKNFLELNKVALSGSEGLHVLLTGASSGMKIKDANVYGHAGGVRLAAGGPDAPYGLIEANQSSFSASSTRIVSGLLGKTLLDNVSLGGHSDALVSSGDNGNTMVKNSYASAAQITVATGAGGVCFSDHNNVFRDQYNNYFPVLSVCE